MADPEPPCCAHCELRGQPLIDGRPKMPLGWLFGTNRSVLNHDSIEKEVG